jgi:hypothetical protein
VVNFALTESGDESVSDSRIDSRKIDFWEKFFSNGARMGREIEINLAFFPPAATHDRMVVSDQVSTIS